MKKLLALVLALAMTAALLTGCSGGGQAESPSPSPSQAEPAPSEEPSPSASAHYRDTMVVYDELEPVNHLVILQNALKFSRDGFYTADTAPAAQEITYNGGSVSAYAMSDAMAMLNTPCEGDLTVVTTGEEQTTMTAAQFSALYVILGEDPSAAPVLYDPDSGAEVTDFWYALTAEGEAIFSVTSGTSYPLTDLLAIAGWDTGADYTVCATDKFHIPVTGEFVGVGEIRGTLSGSINGSFGDLPVASGKISDVVIIQPLQEG